MKIAQAAISKAGLGLWAAMPLASNFAGTGAGFESMRPARNATEKKAAPDERLRRSIRSRCNRRFLVGP
jgi:hypothetical protein